MKLNLILAPAALLVLAGCGAGADDNGAADNTEAEPLSQLDINSSKRQCSTTASMALIGSGVPEDAIDTVCGCTIDKLIADGDYSSESEPSDAASEAALEHCVDELAKEIEKDSGSQ